MGDIDDWAAPIGASQRVNIDAGTFEIVPYRKGVKIRDRDGGLVEVRDDRPELPRLVEISRGRWSAPFDEGSVGVHAALLHTNQVLFFTYDSTSKVTRPPPPPEPEPDHGHDHGKGSELVHPHFPLPFGEWSLLDLPSQRHVVTRRWMNRNLFCAGQCLLGDGRLLVVGGERSYDVRIVEPRLAAEGQNPDLNQRSVFVFDPSAQAWSQRTELDRKRWYPTVFMNGPNSGLAVGGDYVRYSDLVHKEPTIAELSVEEVEADGPRATFAPGFGPNFFGFPVPAQDGGGNTAQYPFAMLLPDGRTFVHFRDQTYLLPRGVFELPAPSIKDDMERTTGFYGTCVMLPLRPTTNPPYRARIMVFGGKPLAGKRGGCSILDTGAAQPEWDTREALCMDHDRMFCDAVLLPDGTVLVVNGCQDFLKTQVVHRPQIFDPRTETWSGPLAFTPTPRLYHSTALLLPDATVLTAGTDKQLNEKKRGTNGTPDLGGVHEDIRRLEVFSPPYLFKGPRPLLTWAPHMVGHGTTFEIATSDHTQIRSAVLIRNGSVTHSFNSDQRLVELAIVQRSRKWMPAPTRQSFKRFGLVYSHALELRAPPNFWVAPSGYYMLFVVSNDGVPSVSLFVQVVARHTLWMRLERFVTTVVTSLANRLLPKPRP